MPSKHAKQTGHSCGRFVLMAAGDNVVLPAYLPTSYVVFIKLYNSIHCQCSLIPNYPPPVAFVGCKKITSKHSEGFCKGFANLSKQSLFSYTLGDL